MKQETPKKEDNRMVIVQIVIGLVLLLFLASQPLFLLPIWIVAFAVLYLAYKQFTKTK